MCYFLLSNCGDHLIITWIHLIIKVSPFIHPDLCYSSGIFIDNLSHSAWESVWTLVPEHMSNMGAWNNFKGASTLPNLCRHWNMVLRFFAENIVAPSGQTSVWDCTICFNLRQRCDLPWTTSRDFPLPKFPSPHHRTQSHRSTLDQWQKGRLPWRGCGGAATCPHPFGPFHVEVHGTWKVTNELANVIEHSFHICSYHRKLSFQLNPPHVISEAVTYSKVSSEMTSMMGQTTAFRFLAISANRGSSQPSVHSQWASRKVITEPFTCFAPSNLKFN